MARRAKVAGGAKLARFMRNTKRAKGKPHLIEVGFLDRRISILAGRVEFGDPASDLPERPAFRQGVADLERELPKLTIDTMKTKDLRMGIATTRTDAIKLGLAARDILKRSYETFTGPGLSETQEARKRGTRGEGRELVGSEGPKLIGHLEVRVDGQVVG